VNGRVEMLPKAENVHAPLVANFVDAVLDGWAVACPIEEAVWTDWVTGEVMG